MTIPFPAAIEPVVTLLQDPLSEARRFGIVLCDGTSTKEMKEIRGCLSFICRQALSDNQYFEFIRSRSYCHDNGFEKIVLCQGMEAVAEVRLHFWGGVAHPAVGCANVHDHSSDIASIVICGSLDETIWRDEGERDHGEYWLFHYGSRREEHSYILDQVGRRDLIRQHTLRISSGMIRAFRHEILHSSEPASCPVLTVFAQSPRVGNQVRVYSRKHGGAGGAMDSPIYSRAQLRRLLGELERLMTD